MTNQDEKELENASNSEEEEELEETGSSDDEDSSDEENVEPDEGEEHQKSRDEFADELERERERLGKKIDKERERRIKAENENLSQEQIQELVRREVSQVESKLTQDRVEQLIEQRTDSPEKKELAMLKYKYSIVHSDNLLEDVENAVALANRKKMRGKISEINQSVKSKENRDKPSGAGSPKKPQTQQKFSQEVIDAAKFAGVSPEEFVKKEQH